MTMYLYVPEHDDPFYTDRPPTEAAAELDAPVTVYRFRGRRAEVWDQCRREWVRVPEDTPEAAAWAIGGGT